MTEDLPALRERLREAVEKFAAQVTTAEQAMLELQPAVRNVPAYINNTTHGF